MKTTHNSIEKTATRRNNNKAINDERTTFAKYYVEEIQGDKTGACCNTTKWMRNAYKKNSLKRTEHLEDLRVGGTKIVKLHLSQ
jgi:hypothetical protein